MWEHIQRKRHECRSHNVVRRVDSIRVVNGLSPGKSLLTTVQTRAIGPLPDFRLLQSRPETIKTGRLP